MRLDRPPHRLANLLHAAVEARQLEGQQPPQGDLVVYHATARNFMGPPTPVRTWGDDMPQGLFAANDPRYLATRYLVPGHQNPSRIFQTRLDPDRIYRVPWLAGVHRNYGQASIWTPLLVQREASKRARALGSERYYGNIGFLDRYDAIMPPPYGDWGGLDSPVWQVILLRPRFETMMIPHPKYSDDEIRRMGQTGQWAPDALATLPEIAADYRAGRYEGNLWLQQITNQASAYDRNPQAVYDSPDWHRYRRLDALRSKSQDMGASAWEQRDARDRMLSTMKEASPRRARLRDPYGR